VISLAPSQREKHRSSRFGLGRIPFAAMMLLVVGSADAATRSPLKMDLTRHSEQFVVHDTRKFGRSFAAIADHNNPELVQLELETLLLSAERIREALVRQLPVPTRGGGKIHCYLYASTRNSDNIVLVSTLFTDGWQYRLEIADEVERTKFVRGIVQALLVELANRGTAHKSAEIPTWLNEGITKQILSDVGPGLILDGVPANALRRSVREFRGANALGEALEFFRTRSPLSFTQLSEPHAVVPTGEELRMFQLSSQLLVAQLFEFNRGRARLVRMLRDLPNCWNWQTAFLQAFEFPRLLDVEKWWSLSVASFLGRESIQSASVDRSLSRVQEIFSVPAQLRLSTNALPVRVEATLGEVISDWDYAQQRPVLQQKIGQLTVLALTAPRELAPLINRYRNCLHSYLLKRDQAGRSPGSKRPMNVPGPVLAREAVRQLATLDEERQSIRQRLTSSAVTGGQPRP